ncbi:MAG: signal recognition particle receptor subunit alpha, partial [Ghiorsea sp.]|nr:signal recognition particle receptor subunit alpha [Ghiorsea sp.]
MSFFSRLSKGLSKSRDNLAAMFPGQAKEKLSDTEWQDIEDGLIMADCGAGLAMNLIEQAKKSKQPMQTLKDTMQQTLNIDKPIHEAKPFVLLVAGVNGTGKTTTIGKL